MPEQEEKERILATARERFFTHGFSKVTVDEIASDLGMSKKTIYKFFPSKEDLIKAIVHAMMHSMERNVEAIVNSDKPFPQKLTEFLALLGKQISKVSKEFQRDMQRYAPGFWKEVETFRRERIFTKLDKMFVQAKQEGFFREDLNTEIFMSVFTHAVEGIMNPMTLSQSSFSPDTAFKNIFRILFEGALTNDARKQVHLFEPSFSKPF